MRGTLCVLILLLLILHQDNWFWTDETLVFGFLPIGLFYHAGISLAAGLMWWWATKTCWPHELNGDQPRSTTAEGDSA